MSTHQNKQTADQGIIKEISKDTKGNFAWYYHEKQKIDRVNVLPTIENGFDSLQVRAYYPYKSRYRMMILSYNKEQWSAVSYVFNYTHVDKDSSRITIDQQQEMTPKSGWAGFITSIRKIDMAALHPPKVYQDGICFDASGITVEIATKNAYRILHYACPSEDQTSQKLKKLMILLKSEFI